MRPLAGLLAGLAMSLSACGSDDGGDTTAPPPASVAFPVIAFNDTIEREIKSVGAADTIRFVAPGSLRLHIGMQQLAVRPALVTLQYALIDSATGVRIDGDHGASEPDGALGPDLGSFLLKWILLPKAATYLIIVTEFRNGADQYVGRYRIRVVGGETRPESASPVLQAGDSLRESIDKPGDIDHFRIVLTGPSKDYIFALRAETGSAADTMIVETAFTVGIPIVGSIGTDADWRVTELGEYDLKTDTVYVRVRALREATTGPYAFKFYKVNRGPERAPQQLVAGDTITEAHDYARDIDDFIFVGDPLREYALAVQSTSGSVRDSIRVALGPFFSVPLLGVSNRLTLLGNVTGGFRGGTHTIRVVGVSDHLKRGGYRLVVLEINRKPESAPQLLAVGDTITETMEFKSDIDEFNVPVTAGDMFVIYAQVLDTDTSSLAFDAFELPGVTFPTPSTGIRFGAWGGAPNLRANRSRTLGANESGIMRVRVDGGNYRGTYRFAIGRLHRTPETANPIVSIDAIVGESLDPPGDEDEYSFDCVQGQEIAGYIRVATGGDAELLLVPAGGHTVGAVNNSVGLLEGPGTGRVIVSATGKCRIAIKPVSTYVNALTNGLALPYEFMIYSVRRAPEVAGPTLRIGDVINESIFPSADIDEFQLSANAGQKWDLCIEETSGVPDESRLVRQVRVFMSLTTPSGASAQVGVGAEPPGCVGPFTAPTTGNFSLYVQGGGWMSNPYRLRIRPVP